MGGELPATGLRANGPVSLIAAKVRSLELRAVEIDSTTEALHLDRLDCAGSVYCDVDDDRAGGAGGCVGFGVWCMESGCRSAEASASTVHSFRAINVVLDSRGGMLDSAFKVTRYFALYVNELHVYVPRRAKSASTLIALGADRVHLSPSGEPGPLATRIADPRNPTESTISALDCYQCVDCIRQFGLATLSGVLNRLLQSSESAMQFPELFDAAAHSWLDLPDVGPVKPLDFGAGGRSLKIGEQYAKKLILEKNPDEERTGEIFEKLVYGYPHHPHPIDCREAEKVGLPVARMSNGVRKRNEDLAHDCHDCPFAGFISANECRIEENDGFRVKTRRAMRRKRL